MGPFTDTLFADSSQLSILVKKYPGCYLDQSGSSMDLRRFVVIIAEEPEEHYFNFLIDNSLAMLSMKFLKKLRDDNDFARRAVAKMTAKRFLDEWDATGPKPRCGQA